MSIIQRFFNSPETSFFLFGPRGVGKSTLMKSTYQNAIWVDLLQPDVLRRYLARPEYLNEVVEASPNGSTIVIDEVQRAPALLSIVHSLIERKRDWQFVLTGSSARKLKQTSADLLGGRALSRALYPFMAAELGEQFSLDEKLEVGLLPLVYGAKLPRDTLEAYISLYLHEEIQAEGLVRNLENFSRFLEVIAFSHASLLNISNISRECEVKRKTIENYITILEDLLLSFQITVFDKRAQRQLSGHPKFYLFDNGVFNVLRPKGYLDKPEEIMGAALEGMVAQHLKAWIDYSREKHQLFFWRTRSGLEVDFIVYGPSGLWAIEVKNAKQVHSKDVRGLREFLKDYPEAKALLLYRGNEAIQINEVQCIPCEKFLLQLRPNQPISE